MSCAQPARGPGRYHREGDPGVWYASNTEEGAWAELFRHFDVDGVDPFELRRRIGSVTVELEVLDLTDEAIRESLGVTEADLVGDDYTVTQEIADAAWAAGFDGIVAPSAALPGRLTLAVFAHALGRVSSSGSKVAQPPEWLADLLPSIRSRPDVPGAVREMIEEIAAELRRRREGTGD